MFTFSRRAFGATSAKVAATVSVAALALTGCSSNSAEEPTEAAGSAAADASTITLEDNFGSKDVTTPVENPAVADNRAFAVLAQWDIDLAAAPLPLVPKSLRLSLIHI